MKPLFDTWKRKKYAGSWVASCDAEGTANRWLAGAVTDALSAFASLSEPTKAVLIADAPGDPITVESGPEASGALFVKRLRVMIDRAAITLHSVELTLDLHVHARTAASPSKPVLARLPDGGRLTLTYDAEDGVGAVEFSINHTLFCPYSVEGHDNRELAALNAPRLQAALTKLARAFGPIEDFEGLPGITKFGFESTEGR